LKKRYKKMDRFEKHMREKLQMLDVEPPADMWPSIEQRLDKASGGRRFVWYRVAAAVAVLMVALYSALFFVPGMFKTADDLVIADEIENTGSFLPESDVITGEQLSGQLNLPAPQSLIVYSESGFVAESDRSGSGLFDQSSQILVETQFTQQEHLAGLEKIIPVTRVNLSFGTGNLLAERSMEKPNSVGELIDFGLEPGSQPALILSAKESIKTTGFSLSAYFSPQESYRYQASTSYIPYESVESQLRSMGIGMNLHYRLSPRFEIQSGIAYSRWGQNVHDIAAYSHPSKIPLYTFQGKPTKRHPQSMITSMGGILFTNQSYYYADVSSSRVLTIRGTFDDSNVRTLGKSGKGLVQQLDFLEIPLVMRYRFIDRGFFVAAKAGVSAHILRSGNVYLEESGKNTLIGSIVDVHTYNLAGTGGLVFGYPLGNKINLLVEPTASMFINQLGVNTNLSGKTYPYSYSVFVGLSYDF
jgi:hypothetical protein